MVPGRGWCRESGFFRERVLAVNLANTSSMELCHRGVCMPGACVMGVCLMGGACLGVCMAGGMCGRGVCAWAACMLGGVPGGHVCLGGIHDMHVPPPQQMLWHMVNEWVVCILLEYIQE